jgi:glycosyltransferase involved in cell wall biosynthesis
VEVCYCGQEEGFGIKSSSLEKSVKDRVGEFDVMHLSAIWHPVARAAHQAARQKGVPVIVSPRGALGPYAWQRRRWLKKIYYALFEREHLKAAAGFHFTSKSEALESAKYIFGQPSCVVPNGIEESLWRRNELAGLNWRLAQGFAKSDLLLLYAGRLHHKKGLAILPAALAKVQPAFPNQRLRFLLVGPNEDGTLQQLENAMVQVGLPGCLHRMPTLPEVALPVIYSAADIFLMPSLHENFGNSAIEALACGCVSLVSAETGCFEFGDGCGMKSVATHDSEQWADAIAGIFQSGRTVVTSNERTELFKRVGLDATAAEMIRFYQTFQT